VGTGSREENASKRNAAGGDIGRDGRGRNGCTRQAAKRKTAPLEAPFLKLDLG
jgi:hypothetical protein